MHPAGPTLLDSPITVQFVLHPCFHHFHTSTLPQFHTSTLFPKWVPINTLLWMTLLSVPTLSCPLPRPNTLAKPLPEQMPTPLKDLLTLSLHLVTNQSCGSRTLYGLTNSSHISKTTMMFTRLC